jgi:hypothetical protein
MALFGGSKRGFFRPPDLYGTPGIGDGYNQPREDGERQYSNQQGIIGALTALAPQTQPAKTSAMPPMTAPQMGAVTRLGSEEQSSFQPALPDFNQGDMHTQLPSSTNLPMVPQPPPGQLDPRLAAIVGNAPVKPKRNTFRDILAGGLAVLGDTLSAPRKGGVGGYSAVDALTKTWGDRSKTFKADTQAYELRRRMASMPGMTERELQAFTLDPKAWAGSMASNATGRYGPATLNPGDTRYLGDGNGSVQAPTRAQQFAQSLNLAPGTPEYDAAIRDQEMGSNGPTAFSNQTTLQNDRQANAMALQSARIGAARAATAQAQRNRMEVRSAPTYRDLNPPAPRSGGRGREKTATGPNGETLYLRNNRWVDAQGNPVQ